MRTLIATGVLAIGLLGCADEPTAGLVRLPLLEEAGVAVTVLDSQPRAGQSVRVRFVSAEQGRIYFHPCVRGVERRVAGAWEPLPPELRLCTAQVFVLEPGAEMVQLVDIPADAPPGTLRFLFPSTREGREGQVPMVSTPFQVASGL